MTVFELLAALDRGLMRQRRSLQLAIVMLAAAGAVAVAVPHVPRPFIDYSHVAFLARVPQPATFGTDTIADQYESRVVLHDPADMYTKTQVEQARS